MTARSDPKRLRVDNYVSMYAKATKLYSRPKLYIATIRIAPKSNSREWQLRIIYYNQIMYDSPNTIVYR